MRVAVVDIGTNSTRLLVADVEANGRLTELVRHSRVTRLGQGVDSTGALAPEAMDRVFEVLADYRTEIDDHKAETTIAVLTSAARDASNGEQFTQAVKDRFDLDARTIPGAEEARLTFLGATSERADNGGQIVVIDVGGGSTELVVGRGGEVSFFVSLQAGVVRHTERYLQHDPPRPDELTGLSEEIAQIIDEGVPPDVRERVSAGVAVAGTATSTAAMDLELPEHDPARTHGHVVTLPTLELLLARLAAMANEERKQVTGLHPDRAATIVAGVAILIQCARAFGLEQLEVSEHDILRGAALRRSSEARI